MCVVEFYLSFNFPLFNYFVLFCFVFIVVVVVSYYWFWKKMAGGGAISKFNRIIKMSSFLSRSVTS